jgi:hypothetical protein
MIITYEKENMDLKSKIAILECNYKKISDSYIELEYK